MKNIKIYVLLSLIIIITIVIIIHVSLSAIEKKDSKCTVSVERFTLILHFVRENLMKWSRIIINIREYDLHERRNNFFCQMWLNGIYAKLLSSQLMSLGLQDLWVGRNGLPHYVLAF